MSFHTGAAASTHEMMSGAALGSIDKIQLWDRVRQSEGRAKSHGKPGDSGEKCLELHCSAERGTRSKAIGFCEVK